MTTDKTGFESAEQAVRSLTAAAEHDRHWLKKYGYIGTAAGAEGSEEPETRELS